MILQMYENKHCSGHFVLLTSTWQMQLKLRQDYKHLANKANERFSVPSAEQQINWCSKSYFTEISQCRTLVADSISATMSIALLKVQEITFTGLKSFTANTLSHYPHMKSCLWFIMWFCIWLTHIWLEFDKLKNTNNPLPKHMLWTWLN